MPNTAKSKQVARRERVAAARARQKRAERRRNLITTGAVAAIIVVIAGGIAWYAIGRSSASAEVIPPGVSGGPAIVQAAAHQVPDTSGILGVTAYVTTGWPQASHNGPAAQALAHAHVTRPVTYSLTPPVGGQHNATWMNCGIYDQPVPNERAVHNMEHGAIWITYQPSLPQTQVSRLRAFAQKQAMLPSAEGAPSRYMDLTPYPGLPSPIVISSWGFQLRVSSPDDPRLQQFVNKFRASPAYTPEYGGACTGGIGTPLQK